MKSEKLEKKIRKATITKDYSKAMYILTKDYKKLFKKMLKYKKINKKCVYLYDYIKVLSKEYKALYGKDFKEMEETLYSGKRTVKQQINWLLDNFFIFKEYKL